MPLSILNDSAHARTEAYRARFDSDHVLERVRRLDERARKQGVSSVASSDDPLVNIGMEVNSAGEVTKNSYGVLDLAWQAAACPEWPGRVMAEVDEIRSRIRDAHGVNIRFLIWAGMGGSIEDKTAYNSIGLLKGGPMFYSLDSTDPAKLKAILADMEARAKEPIAKLLPATLVAGMAMGMTSYEPVVNLERLAALYDKYKIDSTANFIYMTLPGSILDKFAGPRGYRRVPLQLDDANSTAGRHSAPLTRGSLYPLALAGCDLKKWIGGAILSDSDISEALKLSSFLHAQAEQGRDKVTLLLPKTWLGAGLWTKQDFEESLGKSQEIGIKIVIGEKPNPRNYRKVEDPEQDRVFLVVQRKGEAHPDADAITKLRSAHYPIAILTIPAAAPLSHYMQFIHYAVFGLGFLRNMNFVTQPAVELYKSIAAEISEEANQVGGITGTSAWKSLGAGRRWRGVISVETPESLGAAIRDAANSRRIEYGELTFFGDMRYSEGGKLMRKVLETAGHRLFRLKLKMPADIYEGPAMNHSYHEMVIGHGRCFSIVLLSEKQNPQADYHMAQFLATKLALERKQRLVRAILVKDLSSESIETLGDFFSETSRLV